MRAPLLLREKRAFYSIVFLIALTAFSADILDLRQEIHLLGHQSGYLGGNITACIVSHVIFHTDSIPFVCSTVAESSVMIPSFPHDLPYGFRAPPARS
jgi:hypothetical protein